MKTTHPGHTIGNAYGNRIVMPRNSRICQEASLEYPLSPTFSVKYHIVKIIDMKHSIYGNNDGENVECTIINNYGTKENKKYSLESFQEDRERAKMLRCHQYTFHTAPKDFQSHHLISFRRSTMSIKIEEN